MSKEYYEGMFGSLKHNIILMLNQIEGNIEYSKGAEIIDDLTFIQKKVRKIKAKFVECVSHAKGENNGN